MISLDRTEVLGSTLFSMAPYRIAKGKSYPPPVHVSAIKEVGLPDGSPLPAAIIGTEQTASNSSIPLR